MMKNEIEFIDLLNNKTLKKYQRSFKKILKEVKKELDIKEVIGMSVTLCDNNHIQDLNKTYRKKDMATDVLSFAIEDGADSAVTIAMKKLAEVREIGDIVISYDKAVEQAKEYGHSLKREMCFLFTHGVLHLLGYDHMKKSDEEVMFGLQKKILNNLKIVR